MNFFAELKRRHIYRVAAGYAVLAWVLLQLVNNVAPVLDLPPWVARAFLLLLVIGFPVALFFAWMRELAPADGATARPTTGKLDWVLIGALVVVIALVSYQQLALTNGARTAQQQANIAPAIPTAPATTGISIAVLPFANVSGDATQEFFSDGMTDEIIAALAKVPSLQVVARTSAFQFKGEKKDMRAIGQALSVRYLIDGSVRKAGNRVRITAQLVQADNGVGVWTDSYDREIKDIFATQSDIAEAIAGALRVPLGLKQGESLVSNRTSDLDAYQQYLRARKLLNGRAINEATAILELVVRNDPEFAPAWATLAQAYTFVPAFSPVPRSGPIEEARLIVQSALDKAERAARQAIHLDPKHAGAYTALGDIESSRGKWSAAEEFYRQALAIDPDYPDALLSFGAMLGRTGRLKESLRLTENLRTLEPLVSNFNVNAASILRVSGQGEAAIRILELILPTGRLGYAGNVYLAQAYAAQGRYSDAANALLAITGNQVSRRSVEDAARLLRSPSANAGAAEALPTLEGDLGFVYAYVGAPNRVLEYPERRVAVNYPNSNGFVFLWDTLSAPLRKTERFKTLMRDAGMVDYWRQKGWPDLCRPMGADDFMCD